MNKSFIKREVKKMEKEIIFVTHNTGKIKSAEKYFKNLKFNTFNYELDEPRSDDIYIDYIIDWCYNNRVRIHLLNIERKFLWTTGIF
jgi:hypothetical protein